MPLEFENYTRKGVEQTEIRFLIHMHTSFGRMEKLLARS